MNTSLLGWMRAARLVSALALLVTGGDHLYEYTANHYSSIPTIGTLFLLNAVGGFGLGAVLVAPTRKVMPRRYADRLTSVVALAGIGLAGGSLAGLFVSESTPLFGFMEAGYRTTIVVALVAELVAIMALLALLALSRPEHGRRRPHRLISRRAASG
jgi:MFS family permease